MDQVAAVDETLERIEANRRRQEDASNVVPIQQIDKHDEMSSEQPAPKPKRPCSKKQGSDVSPQAIVIGEKRHHDPTITFSTKLYMSTVKELDELHHDRAKLGLHPYRKMDLVEEGLHMVFVKYRKQSQSG